MMKHAPAFLLILMAASAFSATPGRLCVGSNETSFRSDEAECLDVADEKASVPAGLPRLVLYVSGDKATAIFGRVDPARGERNVARGTGSRVPFLLKSTSRRNWPIATELVLKTGTAQWRWSLTAEVAQSLRQISVMPGAYEATLRAPHHEPLQVKFDTRVKTSLPPTLLLNALPVLSGKVYERTGRVPLAGALITDDAGKTLALADAAGEFVAELPADENPSAIHVTSPGFGMKIVALPKTRTDHALPPIELDRAGSIRVRIERDVEKHPKLTIDVARTEGRKQIKVSHGEIAAAAREWLANDLDAGDYMVVIGGTRPLQRLGERVHVAAAEETLLEKRIDAIALTGWVSRAGGPVPGAEIALKSSSHGWISRIVADDAGRFEEELWEGGHFAAVVSGSGLPEPYSFAHEIQDAGLARWEIVIPAGKVAGTVTDALSHRPLKDVDVTLDTTSADNSTRSVGARTDEAGHFVFEGVPEGPQSVSAEAQRYIRSTPRQFALAADQSQSVDIALAHATQWSFVITGRDGQPLINALAVHADLPAGVTPVTDSRGHVDVDINPARGAELLILPASGSFALYRIPAGADVPDQPVPITVAPPTASLDIHAENQETGSAVANVRVLVRYNGELLDPTLVRMFERLRQVSFATDAHGQCLLAELPSGMYELWTYAAAGQAMQLIASRAAPAAALPVTSGSYQVVLKFAGAGAR
jgi:Carboxypeptidase regulatory-like domain